MSTERFSLSTTQRGLEKRQRPLVSQRHDAIKQLDILLGRGYALTARDINEVFANNGFSKAPTAAYMARYFFEAGANFKIIKHKGRTIYLDGSLAEEETDIEEVRKQIEKELSNKNLGLPKS